MSKFWVFKTKSGRYVVKELDPGFGIGIDRVVDFGR